MKIERKSQITGITHEREIPCTPEQLAQFRAGALAQVAFHGLSAEDREFLMTGITPEEWKEFVASDEDED